MSGTSIIGALERAASEHDMPRIGMAVALDEEGAGARSLYARLGYRKAHGPFVTSTNLEADGGGRIPVGAVFDYLVKDLSAIDGPPPHQKQ